MTMMCFGYNLLLQDFVTWVIFGARYSIGLLGSDSRRRGRGSCFKDPPCLLRNDQSLHPELTKNSISCYCVTRLANWYVMSYDTGATSSQQYRLQRSTFLSPPLPSAPPPLSQFLLLLPCQPPPSREVWPETNRLLDFVGKNGCEE